jgi:hypothetical protein
MSSLEQLLLEGLLVFFREFVGSFAFRFRLYFHKYVSIYWVTLRVLGLCGHVPGQ